MPTDKLTNSDLRSIVWYQKAIILCLVADFAVLGLGAMLPRENREVAGIAWVAISLVSTFCVIKLALRTSGVVSGILMGMLAMLPCPCLGIIVLATVNGQATSTLQAHGIKVGFFGARLSDVEQDFRR